MESTEEISVLHGTKMLSEETLGCDRHAVLIILIVYNNLSDCVH